MAAQQGGRFAAVRRYRHAMPGRTNLHHRAASPPERPRYSVRPADRRESGDRWIFQSNAKPENEGRRRRNGQVIGRVARLRLGSELGCGSNRVARGDALEPARCRLQSRRGAAVLRGHHYWAQIARAAPRVCARDGGGFSQRLWVPNSLQLRPTKRSDVARDYHYLFDADLDHRAQPPRARRATGWDTL